MEKRKTKATAEAKEILEGEPVLPEPELSNVEKQSKRYNQLNKQRNLALEQEEEEKEKEKALKEGRVYLKEENSKELPLFI